MGIPHGLADASSRALTRLGAGHDFCRPRSEGGFAAGIGLAALAAALLEGLVVLPDRWNPWAPLWPQEVPNLLTPWKLARLADDPAGCRRALAASGLLIRPEPDRALVRGCGWRDAVRITGLPARVGPPFVLTCPAALSLAMWERHDLQPLAQELFGRRVVAVEHDGSYACRDIAAPARSKPVDGAEGRTGIGRRSEHATANALDIAAFTLEGGLRLSVAGDWSRPADDPRARFLHRLHDGACGWWNVVLGPDYNAAHRDHLHLDRGPYRACR